MGIVVAAIVTTLLSLGLIGGVLFWRSPRGSWPALALAIGLELPMCALAYYLVRTPLQEAIRPLVGSESFFRFLKMFSAPLTEEPAKLWPLLIPFVRRLATKEDSIRLACALGLGFGIGEIWFLAHLVFQNDPKTAALPWYQLGGFLNERFAVCIVHGAFTATALYIGGWRGLLAAMGLHYLGNFPIYLASLGVGGFAPGVYQTLLGLWMGAFLLTMLAWLAYMISGNWQVGKLVFGEATCPDCHVVYPRPLFGVNLGPKRYERCPNCRRWHLL